MYNEGIILKVAWTHELSVKQESSEIGLCIYDNLYHKHGPMKDEM